MPTGHRLEHPTPLADDQVRPASAEPGRATAGRAGAPSPSRVSPLHPSAGAGRPMLLPWVGATASCAMLAPAWMLATQFAGSAAPAVLLGLAVGGVVLAVLAGRGRRAAWMQVLTPLLTLAVLLTAAGDGSPRVLAGAVVDAVRSGQISNPPIVFSSAWQAVCGVLLLTLGPAAVYAALAGRNTRWAAAVPLPVVIGLALVQAPGRELTTTLPALLLSLVAFAVADRGERARDGVVAEPVRLVDLAKTAVALLLVGGAVVGATRFGLLGDIRLQEAPQPPRPPAVQRGETGETLFTMRSTRPTPLRIGTLDTYDGSQWLTPDIDPGALATIGDGALAPAPTGPDGLATVAATSITVASTEVGRFLPLVPGAFAVNGVSPQAQVLPGSGALRTPVATERGASYTVRSARPDPARLARTPFAAAAPTAPPGPAASALVAALPPGATSWARLQIVRRALFAKAVQTTPGTPVAVTPARVEDILRGSPATGFEIAAADGLLARWAGLQSRLAYGYLKQQPDTDGSFTLTRGDGATWVEIKTRAGEWIALVDRPEGTTPAPQSTTTRLVPNGQRTAQLFVPVHRDPDTLVTSVIAWWVGCYLAVAAGLIALWLLVPAGLRAVRARRRARWAAALGVRERIAVEYARLRDAAIDLNVGSATMTPLEFLDALEPDPDHRELAWLVERALWGDLRRDLREDDADAARRLVRSLRGRLVHGQPYAQRVLGFASHASLRAGWAPELPGAYPDTWRRLARLDPGPWTRRALLAGLVAVALLVPFLVGISRPDLRSDPAAAGRLPAVPATVEATSFTDTGKAEAALDAHRAESLLDAAHLYTVGRGGQTVGTLQTGIVKAGLAADDVTVRSGILTQLGMTRVDRIGPYVLYSRHLGDLDLVLWFSPDGRAFQLLTATPQLAKPRELLARTVAATQGERRRFDLIEPILPADAHRGRTTRDAPAAPPGAPAPPAAPAAPAATAAIEAPAVGASAAGSAATEGTAR